MLAALIELRDSIPPVWLEAAQRHMEDQACPTHPLCLANRLAAAVDTLGRATVMMATGSKPVMLCAVSVKGLSRAHDSVPNRVSATALAKKVQKITAHVAAVDIPHTMRAQWTPERMSWSRSSSAWPGCFSPTGSKSRSGSCCTMVCTFRAVMPLHLTVSAGADAALKTTAHRRSRIYHTHFGSAQWLKTSCLWYLYSTTSGSVVCFSRLDRTAELTQAN